MVYLEFVGEIHPETFEGHEVSFFLYMFWYGIKKSWSNLGEVDLYLSYNVLID